MISIIVISCLVWSLLGITWMWNVSFRFKGRNEPIWVTIIDYFMSPPVLLIAWFIGTVNHLIKVFKER